MTLAVLRFGRPSFAYDQIVALDRANLDIFWREDGSQVSNPDNLDPGRFRAKVGDGKTCPRQRALISEADVSTLPLSIR